MGAEWPEFHHEVPEFAERVRRRLEDPGLVMLATLRRDGSPRISGLEIVFHDDRLWLAMMPDSAKGRDLRRDGRFALHNATVDKEVSQGDVKVNGVARPLAPEDRAGAPAVGPEADLFATRLTGVSMVAVANDRLIIESWRPGRAMKRFERT